MTPIGNILRYYHIELVETVFVMPLTMQRLSKLSLAVRRVSLMYLANLDFYPSSQGKSRQVVFRCLLSKDTSSDRPPVFIVAVIMRPSENWFMVSHLVDNSLVHTRSRRRCGVTFGDGP